MRNTIRVINARMMLELMNGKEKRTFNFNEGEKNEKNEITNIMLIKICILSVVY